MRKISICLFFLAIWNLASAQEENKEEEGSHFIGIAIGHSHVSQGFVEGKRQVLTLPSWELGYNYRLSKKFLIGIHSDIIIEKYFVENSKDEVIERNYPYSLALVGIYKFNSRFAFEFGGGMEFDPKESLELIKLGLEYAVPLAGGFEMTIIAGYDFIIDTYDSVNYGIGVAKVF